MPTIFERIDTGLQGNDFSAKLTAQVGHLGSVVATVTNLIKSPPQGLGDLSKALNELPLPDIQVSGDFSASLTRLKTAIPADLSSVTGGLIANLGDLAATVETQITEVLKNALDAVLTIQRLMQIDLRCDKAGGSGSAGAASGGSGGATPGGGSPGTGGSPSPGGSATGSARQPAPGPTGLAGATAQVNAINNILDKAPSPFNVEGALAWLRDATVFEILKTKIPISLPIFDELVDPLQTLHAWKSMGPAEIRGHIALTLQNLIAFIQSAADGPLSPLEGDLAATAANLHGDTLAQIANDLTANLAKLQAAVNSGDLSATGDAVNQINGRLDEYEILKTALKAEVLEKLPKLNGLLKTLPDDLSNRMSGLLSFFQPKATLGILEGVFSSVETADAAALAQIEEKLKPLLDWVKGLTDKLDLTALKDPIKAVADAAKGAVDGLEKGLSEVTIQVRAIFEQVESLLGAVDTAALVNQVKSAINDFATQLAKQLEALFKPVRDAVAQVVKSIDDGLGAFNPEDIIEALRNVFEALTNVLKDEAVVSALGEIQNTLNTATEQLKKLSFEPLTDQVVEGIDEVTETLKGIDTSKLNTALQLALQAALAILPESLTPVTDPFIGEFEDLVKKGPVVLLEKVKQEPRKLLDKVRGFEPATLIGDALSKPYKGLLEEMEPFKPSGLLKPVDQEFEKLKGRLKKDANPGAAIQLLEQPFNEMMQAFDRLKPDELVKPLDDAIKATIDKILKILPVDEVFGQVDGALKKVEEVITFGKRLAAVLEKLQGLLGGFADSRGQLEAWINSILDKVEAMGDTSPLAPYFVNLSTAVDKTKAASLAGRFQAASGPVLTALDSLDPQSKLAGLVEVYGNFPRVPLAALPSSPEKTAINTMLGRFNPLDPAFGAPYRELATFRENLLKAQSGLQTVLGGWDDRYQGEQGVLAGFRLTGATPAELRQWIHESLGPQFIQPFKTIFSLVEMLSSPVGALLSVFKGLVTDLDTKMGGLLLGPDSLGGIRDAMKALVKRLQDFNLDSLKQGLKDVFAEVRSKLDAVNPAQLRQAIEAAFDDMLKALSVSQVLPAADVTKLDDDYAKLIEKLKALDPGKLVTEVVQPEFEEKVLPLLDAFDLTKLFDAMIERLNSLDEELKKEMEKVNKAYQSMRDAVPPMSLGLDIDIGVDIGF